MLCFFFFLFFLGLLILFLSFIRYIDNRGIAICEPYPLPPPTCKYVAGRRMQPLAINHSRARTCSMEIPQVNKWASRTLWHSQNCALSGCDGLWLDVVSC